MTLHVLHTLAQASTCMGAIKPDDFVLIVDKAVSELVAKPHLLATLPNKIGTLLFELDEAAVNALDNMGNVVLLSDDQWVELTEIHHNQVVWA
jgi:sulfur transfer complex TusBCD TusB component (DsrH family)